uniref:Uncharacterized protein n=1 Tax=Caulerpa lentillifera TaxID=148947 RepID=A0A2Z2QKG6_9CHLO|nr:hypothetical protein [Caulerpa lentillifera]AST24237.1 hypothetical protein [Caulerpa lentillifera]
MQTIPVKKSKQRSLCFGLPLRLFVLEALRVKNPQRPTGYKITAITPNRGCGSGSFPLHATPFGLRCSFGRGGLHPVGHNSAPRRSAEGAKALRCFAFPFRGVCFYLPPFFKATAFFGARTCKGKHGDVLCHSWPLTRKKRG